MWWLNDYGVSDRRSPKTSEQSFSILWTLAGIT